jgi:hypothetical protein
LLNFQLDRDVWAKYFAVLSLSKGEDVFLLSLFLRRLNVAQLVRCQESVSGFYSTDLNDYTLFGFFKTKASGFRPRCLAHVLKSEGPILN